MPVLPDVGSISTVSALTTPAFSIAVIMAAPMRSFTLAAGLKYSSLARIVAPTPCIFGNLFRRTIGVSPMASTMESNTRPRPGRCSAAFGVGASIAASCNENVREKCVVPYLGADRGKAQEISAGTTPSLQRKTAENRNHTKPTYLCCDNVKE